MTEVILDVRERHEYEAEHIPGSVLIPLSEFLEKAPAFFKKHAQAKKVIFMCRVGGRSQKALMIATEMGWGNPAQFENYIGGIMAWKAAGLPVSSTQKGCATSVERQTYFTLGGLLILSTALGAVFDMRWLLVPMLIGTGLLVAGFRQKCYLTDLLARMPWNKH